MWFQWYWGNDQIVQKGTWGLSKENELTTTRQTQLYWFSAKGKLANKRWKWPTKIQNRGDLEWKLNVVAGER